MLNYVIVTWVFLSFFVGSFIRFSIENNIIFMKFSVLWSSTCSRIFLRSTWTSAFVVMKTNKQKNQKLRRNYKQTYRDRKMFQRFLFLFPQNSHFIKNKTVSKAFNWSFWHFTINLVLFSVSCLRFMKCSDISSICYDWFCVPLRCDASLHLK